MPLSVTTLTAEEFARFSRLIYDRSGIKLNDTKVMMLSARLLNRLNALRFSSYGEYLEYVLSKEGQQREMPHLIDVVSTNKTDFFRGQDHFDFLSRHIAPFWHGRARERGGGVMRLWSAACSTGEEPFSMAMVLREFQLQNQGFEFAVLATDISTRVLEAATTAIYSDDRLEPVPQAFRERYFMRGKGEHEGVHRIVPELRKVVRFQHLNFLQQEYDIDEPLDVIFCRNVMIYFDSQTQRTIFRRMCRHLRNGGFFFVGHSETLMTLREDMVRHGPSIYQKPC